MRFLSQNVFSHTVADNTTLMLSDNMNVVYGRQDSKYGTTRVLFASTYPAKQLETMYYTLNDTGVSLTTPPHLFYILIFRSKDTHHSFLQFR